MTNAIDRVLHPVTRGDAMGINGPWPSDRARIAPFVQQCHDLAVGMARVSCDWTAIQRDQKPGVYNVEQFAPLLDALNAAGIATQVVCGYVPNYLRQQRPYGNTIPDDDKLEEALREYEASVYALGRRFPYLNIIELWSNECNATFGCNPVRPDIAYLLGAVGAHGWNRAKREQGAVSVVLTNSFGTTAEVATDPTRGRTPYHWLDDLYRMHAFFCGLNHVDPALTPTPWHFANHHPYMTWGDAFAAANQVDGNALTYTTTRLVADQTLRATTRSDIHTPYVWGSEAGWPTTLGHGVDNDVRYMARVGGWTGTGTPTTTQCERGAGLVAKAHLKWWFAQQDAGHVGPFNIFYMDGNPNGNGWPYGLYTDLVGGHPKQAVCAAVRSMATRSFTPPPGWMAGVGVPT